MAILKVDKRLCKSCGTCAEVCGLGIIKMGTEDLPIISLPDACCACGHCVASCPNAALDNDKAPLINQKTLHNFPVIDSDTAADFMRSRRSVRSYERVSVPRESILKLLEIARYSPSGHNSQGLSYTVIDNPEILKKISETTIEWLEGLLKANVPWVIGLRSIIDTYRNTGTDTILRGAPCLIAAIAPVSHGMAQDNAKFSLEYVELYATSLGMGTCWAGFVQLCAGARYQPIMELLNIKEDTAVVGALLAGYPKNIYKRLVDRNPLQVDWI